MYGAEHLQPELERASSEGQPTIVAGARRQPGASAGSRAIARVAEHRTPWEPGTRSQNKPLRQHPREAIGGAYKGPPPFVGWREDAAVLPLPLADEVPLQADAQADPSTLPCGPVGPLPRPDLGFDTCPVTPPSELQSPLAHAHSAAAMRGGLPSVRHLRVEALAGHAQSFTTGAARGGAAGGLEGRQAMRARARSGELRSLMALHVYEHGVEEIAKVVTEYQ